MNARSAPIALTRNFTMCARIAAGALYRGRSVQLGNGDLAFRSPIVPLRPSVCICPMPSMSIRSSRLRSGTFRRRGGERHACSSCRAYPAGDARRTRRTRAQGFTARHWACRKGPSRRLGGGMFEDSDLQIYLGVEQDFRPAQKAHPALVVHDLKAWIIRLTEAATKGNPLFSAICFTT